MTYKLVCTVDNNQVIVPLPPNFSNKKQVIVMVDDQMDARAQKLEQLKMAATDRLFLADIQEIRQDFDSIDHETL
jgi:hypothetical protein